MTAKETQRMQRLELENAQLRAQVVKQFDVYRETLFELIELKAKLDLIESALRGEA